MIGAREGNRKMGKRRGVGRREERRGDAGSGFVRRGDHRQMSRGGKERGG